MLAFFTGAPTPFNFAALYPVTLVKREHVLPGGFPYKLAPIKYIPLSRHPLSYPQGPVPATVDYERDQAIDTVPAKQLLVMGQQWNNGIIVYHYDPQAQTLQRVWDAVIH